MIDFEGDKKNMRSDIFFFGRKKAEKYGDLICEKLAGHKISKSKLVDGRPGSLRSEAESIGMDMWDLLEALEGLSYIGKVRILNDTEYLVLERKN